MRISDWSSDVCSSDLTAITPISAGGTLYGIAGEMHAAGGTVTLGNANSVQLTGTDTSYIGIGTTSSTGQVDIANTGTLALSTQGGNATGLYIARGGTAGDGTLTNQGVLSVATQSSAGGARAIGMDVEQGTSATLISQRTGATGGMTVTGGLAKIGRAHV